MPLGVWYACRIMTMISDNLDRVHARIAAACNVAGRDVNLVTLLAVSKTFGAEDVQQAIAAGQTAFGENYIQEAVQKIQLIRQWEGANAADRPSQWHCIGPIQSNKTRLVAENFDWAHTVDRLKIAQRLSEQRPANLPPLQVCIQVNVDGGPTQSGVAPGEALALAQAVAALPRLVLRGLMCIPDVTPNTIANYSILTSAKALSDHIRLQNGLPGATAALFTQFDTLSMGMTADLEAAVRAGSTMVRVGTAIFGGRALWAPLAPLAPVTAMPSL